MRRLPGHTSSAPPHRVRAHCHALSGTWSAFDRAVPTRLRTPFEAMVSAVALPRRPCLIPRVRRLNLSVSKKVSPILLLLSGALNITVGHGRAPRTGRFCVGCCLNSLVSRLHATFARYFRLKLHGWKLSSKLPSLRQSNRQLSTW